MVSRAVLITGCSSGIGKATAEHLAARGWTVYATGRRLQSIDNLAAQDCTTLALDVTDEESMRRAVGVVEKEHGAVGVLVNNAGYSQSGAVETMTMPKVRDQFETNLFGPIRLTQLVLPGMRRQRWGKIVNMSSMGGRLVFPGGGIYHATKWGLEAVSDALRFEVAAFGIDVIVVEPGIVRTGFSSAAVTALNANQEANQDAESNQDDPYEDFNASVEETTLETYVRGPVARLGGGPETVARVVERAITARRPRTRYRVTAAASLLIGLRRVVSDRVWDRLVATRFRQPTPP